MARIFSDGAEFGDLLFWTTTTNMSLSATARTGNYSYYGTVTAANASKAITALSELYIRFGAYTGNYDTNNKIMGFRSGSTLLCYVNLDALSHVNFFVNAVSVEDSGVAMSFNQWHLFECYLKIADAPNGRFILYMDGVKIIDYTGDTKPGADTTIDNIYISRAGTPVYYDDLALNDTSGGSDNSWCGDEHYELQNPNDNGDTNSWTGSDGDKVNNYALVDEIPPTGDTDYVKSDTASEQDMYGLSAFTDTGKIVTRIWAECRARDAGATAGEIKIGYKTGGTVYLCSTDRVLTSNYSRVVGDEATVNPADSGVWEKADLDALQFVAECE